MRILVYGAGGLGSFLAAQLFESGQDVSLLARGQRLADLQERGLILEDLITHARRTYAVNVVSTLEPADFYDWVIIVMGKDHLPEILPLLSANLQIRNYLFMGNNVEGGTVLTQALGRQRVMMGFLMAVGKVNGPVAYAANQIDGQVSPSRIGELDGSISPRLIEISAIFENAQLPVQISEDIQAYLKCHAALIVPLAGAYYLSGMDLKRMQRTRDVQIILLRAVREAIQVLRYHHIPITPNSFSLFLRLPEPVKLWIVQMALENPDISYALIHADGVRSEINLLGHEFSVLARQVGMLTPHFDRLLLATAHPSSIMPDGSRKLPLDWRSTMVWIGGLAAVISLIYGLTILLRPPRD